MMDYQQFRAFKEEITQERDLLRLDCMNPFKAMNFLKRQFEDAPIRTVEQTLDLWAQTMDMAEYRDIAIASGGVRESLKALFNIYAADSRELWLPEDVYPFYWDTATEAGLAPRSFPTLPEPDLSVLNSAADNAVVVITNPVSPLGRMLDGDEAARIKDWLAQSPDRRIILDTVYAYTRDLDEHTHELFETGQCYVAHSLSKAWLERGVFGVLLAPEADREQSRKAIAAPSVSAATSAYAALKHQSDLPDIQQTAFSKEWERLTPAIQEFAPDFTPPETGYFKLVEVNAAEVLKNHGALVVPASVFGSRNPDLSIVTCLFDMK